MSLTRPYQSSRAQVEALRLLPNNIDAAVAWVNEFGSAKRSRSGVEIDGPDGLVFAREGDWIIRDHRTYYPVTETLFHRFFSPYWESTSKGSIDHRAAHISERTVDRFDSFLGGVNEPDAARIAIRQVVREMAAISIQLWEQSKAQAAAFDWLERIDPELRRETDGWIVRWPGQSTPNSQHYHVVFGPTLLEAVQQARAKEKA